MVAVLANRLDGARLRTLVAGLFVKADLGAELQALDPADDAVAMEVNLAPVLGREASVSEIRFEMDDASVRRSHVRLDVASQVPDVVFELPPRRRKASRSAI